MRPHQIQRDPPVDLPRSSPRRNLKVIRVDFAHESTFVFHYDKIMTTNYDMTNYETTNMIRVSWQRGAWGRQAKGCSPCSVFDHLFCLLFLPIMPNNRRDTSCRKERPTTGPTGSDVSKDACRKSPESHKIRIALASVPRLKQQTQSH